MRIERCGLDAEGTAGGLLKRIPAEWRRKRDVPVPFKYVRPCVLGVALLVDVAENGRQGRPPLRADAVAQHDGS